MNTLVSIKKIVVFPVVLCLFFAFQQSAFAQNNVANMGPKSVTTKTVTEDYKGEKAARAEIKTPGGQKGNKMVYGFLSVDKEGMVKFDAGKGADKLVNPATRAPFRSVIEALNHLAQSDKWQISHTYSLTTGSPSPAFILYHYEPIQ